MSEADYLVGVEEYELAFVEDVLDDAPVDAQTVYKETINMSERAIAAEAAFRATSGGGGGGGTVDSVTAGDGTITIGGTAADPTVVVDEIGTTNIANGAVTAAKVAADVATQAELDAHINDATDAHDATAVSFAPAGTIAATTVQAAIEEVASEAGAGSPAASAVTVDSTTLVGTGTDAQAVFEELDNAIVAAETATANHLADAADAHDASAISSVAAGGLVATDVQAALNELDTEKQPIDATLTALAAANWAANSVPVGTGADTLSQTAMAASTVLARLASGDIVAATVAQMATLLAPALAGYQYARAAITTNATTTATSAATATTVITLGAITPGAGVPIRIIAQGAYLANTTTAATVLTLWRAIDGGAAVDLGTIQQGSTIGSGTTNNGGPVHGEYDDTPGAGSIVYTLRMWVSSASTGTLHATSTYTAASLRAVKV